MSLFTSLLPNLGREYDPLLANELGQEVYREVSRRVSSIIRVSFSSSRQSWTETMVVSILMPQLWQSSWYQKKVSSSLIRAKWKECETLVMFLKCWFGNPLSGLLVMWDHKLSILLKSFWPGLSVTCSQKHPTQCTANQVQSSRGSCRVFFYWIPPKIVNTMPIFWCVR